MKYLKNISLTLAIVLLMIWARFDATVHETFGGGA